MGKSEKNKNKGRKQVDILHLIYLGIIAVGCLVWLGAYVFRDSLNAGSHLNFAATLSSILLAVIAIVITLIDVAGQRSNIFDVKNSVENLETVSDKIEEMVERYNEQNTNTITKLISLVNELSASHKEMTEQLNAIVSKIEKLPSDITEVKDLQEEAKKVNEKIKKKNSNIEVISEGGIGKIVKIPNDYFTYSFDFTKKTKDVHNAEND